MFCGVEGGTLTRQKVSWIFLSCEHDKFLGFWFFLSGRQLSLCKRWILFNHYLLMVAMIISRRLVSLGRKLCLFVYYVKHVDNKQWVAKEATTFNGGVESRMVHDNIRRGIQRQCKQVYWFCGFCFIRLEVEFVDICSCFLFSLRAVITHGRPYVFVSIRLYKGLMLKVDDEQKKIQAIEIRACRRIHLHGTLVEPFLNPTNKANV
jgi:hypothetical protein